MWAHMLCDTLAKGRAPRINMMRYAREYRRLLQVANDLHLQKAGHYDGTAGLLLRRFAQSARVIEQSPFATDPKMIVLRSPGRRRLAKFLGVFLPISGTYLLYYAYTHPDPDWGKPAKLPPEYLYLQAQQTPNSEMITNWSDTHSATPRRYFQAETEDEVQQYVSAAHNMGQRLRVVGSALSPNGLGLSEDGMLSVALLDKVISVDAEKQQVTVQAGCRIQQVADALKPYGLSLQNYASIREQQVGGYTQVGAHGTGATLPPVDEHCVALTMATPGLGVLKLSVEEEPELFAMARLGLGSLGVVTRMTLQAVPRQQLKEVTFTTDIADIKKNHVQWLSENKHLRYMWLPYTDSVVVVKANPLKRATAEAATTASESKPMVIKFERSDDQRLAPLRELYAQKTGTSTEQHASLSATQLRDALLALGPLDQPWVAQVNKAEAEYWRRSSGTRVGFTDEILGFDCGGQQWVLETAFPIGNRTSLRGRTKDIEYMETLLSEIQRAKIPAPSPIEQRWTSGSSSPLSPAHGPPDSVHSWVGIIMYLPEEAEARAAVTSAFHKYARIVNEKLIPRFNGAWHWAKLELPESEAELAKVRARLAARYPIARLQEYRQVLDPKNILSNAWLDALFPRKTVVEAAPAATAPKRAAA